MELFRAWRLPTGLWRLLPPSLHHPASLLPFSRGRCMSSYTQGNGCSPVGAGCSRAVDQGVQVRNALCSLSHLPIPSSHPWAWPQRPPAILALLG